MVYRRVKEPSFGSCFNRTRGNREKRAKDDDRVSFVIVENRVEKEKKRKEERKGSPLVLSKGKVTDLKRGDAKEDCWIEKMDNHENCWGP